MARTPADLLDKTYNRQVFSNPVALPATNLPYLDGVRFIYNLGRLKSYNDDRAALLADLTAEADAERKALDTYRAAWHEQWGEGGDPDYLADARQELIERTKAWQEYDTAWIKRLRLRIAAFLIERVTWERKEAAPDPRDEASLLELEPDAWASKGETFVLNVLTSPEFLAAEVGPQIQSPFLLTRSMATGGKS
jgi:hypothetical protein